MSFYSSRPHLLGFASCMGSSLHHLAQLHAGAATGRQGRHDELARPLLHLQFWQEPSNLEGCQVQPTPMHSLTPMHGLVPPLSLTQLGPMPSLVPPSDLTQSGSMRSLLPPLSPAQAVAQGGETQEVRSSRQSAHSVPRVLGVLHQLPLPFQA